MPTMTKMELFKKLEETKCAKQALSGHSIRYIMNLTFPNIARQLIML